MARGIQFPDYLALIVSRWESAQYIEAETSRAHTHFAIET
jgi:hypothetical protein